VPQKSSSNGGMEVTKKPGRRRSGGDAETPRPASTELTSSPRRQYSLSDNEAERDTPPNTPLSYDTLQYSKKLVSIGEDEYSSDSDSWLDPLDDVRPVEVSPDITVGELMVEIVKVCRVLDLSFLPMLT